MSRKIWISWEDHRRSRVLAEQFSCDYFPLLSSTNRLIRYPVLTVRTVVLLMRLRPDSVFCQNPSVVLAAICSLLKGILRYSLIIDRHSNFKLDTLSDSSFKWRLFHVFSDYSIRKAELTIVTNAYLQEIVSEKGGNACILQDKIPSLKPDSIAPEVFRNSRYHIMCVTMFDSDEPIDELVQAGKQLSNDFSLYLTGNYTKRFTESEKQKLSAYNILLCGFLDEKTYVDALAHCDAIVVLTKQEYILNCGAYEALAVNNSLVLSDTVTLKEYFGEGPIYTNPTDCNAIVESITSAVENRDSLRSLLLKRREELNDEWQEQFDFMWNRVK